MNYAKEWEVQKCVLYITLWKKTMNELPEQIYASSIACLTSKDVLYGEKYMVSLDYYSLWGIDGMVFKSKDDDVFLWN